MFHDLENTLQHLDISGNNVTNFEYEFMEVQKEKINILSVKKQMAYWIWLCGFLFKKFMALRSLNLGDNYMAEIQHAEANKENKSNFQLLRLDMSGKTNKPVDLQKFYR